MKAIINMAADRGAFICQSQSLNLFMENASFAKLTSMHFYAWEKGLKTGMYYLRTRPAVDPIKFTLSAKHQRVQADVESTLPLQNTVIKPVPFAELHKNNDAKEFAFAKTMSETTLEVEDNSFCSLDDPDCVACSA